MESLDAGYVGKKQMQAAIDHTAAGCERVRKDPPPNVGSTLKAKAQYQTMSNQASYIGVNPAAAIGDGVNQFAARVNSCGPSQRIGTWRTAELAAVAVDVAMAQRRSGLLGAKWMSDGVQYYDVPDVWTLHSPGSLGSLDKPVCGAFACNTNYFRTCPMPGCQWISDVPVNAGKWRRHCDETHQGVTFAQYAQVNSWVRLPIYRRGDG